MGNVTGDGLSLVLYIWCIVLLLAAGQLSTFAFLPGLMVFVLKLKIIENMCKKIITTYCLYYIFDFG